MNILEEIASEKTLAMTDRVILLQLMICSVSSFGYYSYTESGLRGVGYFFSNLRKGILHSR
ncbi:MAG: hypothetical protein JETT_3851 [Candidatus Jettenia ecosi]|uniref:Uncharacterized protein n=1 Tax=Candidatus Jettenia ecosi TaxID=2494326 RepID=A0A533Q5R1_9BACT|nr:MAG: hypothetical protein JETT_3851 [Candidatus Jettenia ecosi]